MTLPDTLISTLTSYLGPVMAAIPVGGGDISQAARLRLASGTQALVKWRSGSLPGLFTAERRGLELLRLTRALRTPEVLAQAEATTTSPAFIALEWLDSGSKSASSAEILGTGLATQHRFLGAAFGLDHDNFIGANPQPNRQADNWIDFFRDQRLGFQMELAARNGLLPGARARRLESLLKHLGDWLPPQPAASLLHGDLWGGNWLTTTAGQPALIDPAVYYGHREADLAFTELFGGFPGSFDTAYRAAWPLDPGYDERKELYNLYHLLNHLNLFGESYGSGVDSILRRYGG